jgi:hypothetical protein
MKVTPGRSNFPVMVAASRYPEKKRSGQVRKTCSPVRSLYAFMSHFSSTTLPQSKGKKIHAVGKGPSPL